MVSFVFLFLKNGKLPLWDIQKCLFRKLPIKGCIWYSLVDPEVEYLTCPIHCEDLSEIIAWFGINPKFFWIRNSLFF